MTEKQKQALQLGRQKGLVRNRPTGLKYVLHKINPTSFKKGHTPFYKGKFMKSDNEYSSNYDAVHSWVERKLGIPKKCDFCGDTTKSRYHWANKTGQYKHEITDWLRLCMRCHSRYDYEKFGARRSWYE